MKKLVVLAALAAVIVLALPALAWAGGMANGVTGSVRGASDPIAGIAVKVFHDGVWAGETETGSEGSYAIPLEPGDYSISFDPSGFNDATDHDYIRGTANFSVTAGEVTTVNHTLTLGGRISGSVTSTAGAIANITVNLSNGDTALTESDGSFVFRAIPAGDYVIDVDPTVYNSDNGTNYGLAVVSGVEVESGGKTVQNVVLSYPAPPVVVSYTRLHGTNRYLTAIAVSQDAFPATATVVVLASGANFPDALAAAPLAKAYGGPVLLTPPAGLTKEVLDEVKRLAPDKVFIAGSGKAVSTVVETQLSTLSKKPSVKRFAGVDRFDTAAQIAEELQSKVGAPERVIVVNGYKFPDALSAAPLAAAKGWPILLTKVNSVPNYTSAAITKSGASLSLVAGSETVVDKNVYNALPGPTRAGGDNRYETCGLVADFAVSQGCSYEHVGIAKGTDFPDALAAGPYLGAKNGIGLLSYPDSLPKPILDRLKANKMSVATVDIFGSTNAIADAVIFEIDDALR